LRYTGPCRSEAGAQTRALGSGRVSPIGTNWSRCSRKQSFCCRGKADPRQGRLGVDRATRVAPGEPGASSGLSRPLQGRRRGPSGGRSGDHRASYRANGRLWRAALHRTSRFRGGALGSCCSEAGASRPLRGRLWRAALHRTSWSARKHSRGAPSPIGEPLRGEDTASSSAPAQSAIQGGYHGPIPRRRHL